MHHRRASALDRRPSSAAERSRGTVRNNSALSVGGRVAPTSTLSSVKALYGPSYALKAASAHAAS